MSTENIVGLTLCIAITTFIFLGLFGVIDRIRTGKWPPRPGRPKLVTEKGDQVLYVGMGDFWIDKGARCAACDALFTEAGGFFWFDNGSWKCCITCMDRPMNVVAANIFQMRKDWSLHRYFCDCKGSPSKPREQRRPL